MMTHKHSHLGFEAYPQSHHEAGNTQICMVKTGKGSQLLVQGENPGFEGESVTHDGVTALLAPLNHHNAGKLREVFPFTAPRPGLENGCSIGVGDRLGIATPGHLKVFARYPKVFPILAQQSIRELNLTKRTYEDVLNAASFAVFREGYTSGFGADGDHLKKPEEIEYALGCGFSMITLDCSEHIRNDVPGKSLEELQKDPQGNANIQSIYADKTFDLDGGMQLHFSKEDALRADLIYSKAIAFMAQIYERYVKGQRVDFEISIDETMTPTSPKEHYFVASELKRLGVVCQSLAPRFCGEFQKGIDYIGDHKQFEEEMKVHAAIARHFGYKVSVHSGSDKFSVFPAVGRQTGGVFHLKTAGTNWLEAVRLVAIKDPALYRAMHQFALDSFKEASAYYHVKAKPENVPALDTLSDAQLPGLMDQEDARQVLHITYGLILTAKNEDGTSRFKDALYALWHKYEDDYAELLSKHIGRHVDLLLK